MPQTQTSKEVLPTPTPWFVSHSPVQLGAAKRPFKSIKTQKTIGGKIIANAYGGSGILKDGDRHEAEANAYLIVKAVNHYQKLQTISEQIIETKLMEIFSRCEAKQDIKDATKWIASLLKYQY